jgi:hypothetical protein
MTGASDPATRPDAGDRYTFGDEAAVRQVLRQRLLATCAPFLLPHLRPGLRLLDCGCGPGSLTLELAAHVAPGEVVGIDREPGQGGWRGGGGAPGSRTGCRSGAGCCRIAPRG